MALFRRLIENDETKAINAGALYKSAEFDDRNDDKRNETQCKPKLKLTSYWGTKSVSYSSIYIKSLYYELRSKPRRRKRHKTNNINKRGR